MENSGKNPRSTEDWDEPAELAAYHWLCQWIESQGYPRPPIALYAQTISGYAGAQRIDPDPLGLESFRARGAQQLIELILGTHKAEELSALDIEVSVRRFNTHRRALFDRALMASAETYLRNVHPLAWARFEENLKEFPSPLRQVMRAETAAIAANLRNLRKTNRASRPASPTRTRRRFISL